MPGTVRVSRFVVEADEDTGGTDLSADAAAASLRAFAGEATKDALLIADDEVDVLLTFSHGEAGLRLGADFPGPLTRRFFVRVRPQLNVVIEPVTERQATRVIQRLAARDYRGLASELGQPWL